MALVAGYEDCNDHTLLRRDPGLKTATKRRALSGSDLASQPTLSRFENSVTRRDLWRLAEAFVEHFLDRHDAPPPREIVLDFDATVDPTHGQQDLSFYHGYYGCHCYLPLLAFASCDGGPKEPLLAVLRPGNSHAGRAVIGLLRRLVARLRARWPEVRIVFRGDSGMALPGIYDFCEGQGVEYVIGIGRNATLAQLIEPIEDQARELHAATGEKVRHFGEFRYQAGSWERPRRVVAKAEIIPGHERDTNRRFVVTNRTDLSAEDEYDYYVERGDAECRIDELKNGCFCDRTSCSSLAANQFRLMLSMAAYLLLMLLRERAEAEDLRRAQAGTLRLRLIKLGARVTETARSVKLSLAGNYPRARDWIGLAGALGAVIG